MTKGLFSGLLMVGLLSGCASSPAPDEAPRPPSLPDAGKECDASPIQVHLGESLSDDLEQRLVKASQAQRLRLIRPNQGYTMDYQRDRLNVHLDQQGRIEQLSCG